MNKIKGLITTVNGKKTYILTGATIIYVVLGYLLHQISFADGITMIGGLGSIAALRHGVSKAQTVISAASDILAATQAAVPTEPAK